MQCGGIVIYVLYMQTEVSFPDNVSCDPLLNRVPDPFIRTNGASWYSICVNCKPITNSGSGTPKSANWLSAISAWCNNMPIITVYRQFPIFLMRVSMPYFTMRPQNVRKKKKKNWSRVRIAWETRVEEDGACGSLLCTVNYLIGNDTVFCTCGKIYS